MESSKVFYLRLHCKYFCHHPNTMELYGVLLLVLNGYRKCHRFSSFCFVTLGTNLVTEGNPQTLLWTISLITTVFFSKAWPSAGLLVNAEVYWQGHLRIIPHKRDIVLERGIADEVFFFNTIVWCWVPQSKYSLLQLLVEDSLEENVKTLLKHWNCRTKKENMFLFFPLFCNMLMACIGFKTNNSNSFLQSRAIPSITFLST